MLWSVPLSFFKFREILNNSLHVFNSVELGLTLLFGKEFLNKRMNGISHISKIVKHDLTEEIIILARQDNFFHFIWKVWQMFKINSIVLEAN